MMYVTEMFGIVLISYNTSVFHGQSTDRDWNPNSPLLIVLELKQQLLAENFKAKLRFTAPMLRVLI